MEGGTVRIGAAMLRAVIVGACMLASNDAVLAARQESGRLVRLKDVTIYCEVIGAKTGTPLFVVNGGPGFDHMYVHCSNAWEGLARNRPVVFYDQRGNGKSTALKAGQSCTLADQIADLDGLRAALGYDRIDLLGHSWGGYLVMAYASRHPEHLSHLIIVDSAAPKWSDTVFLFKDIFPEATERQAALAFASELGDSAAVTADLREYMGLLFYAQENRDRFFAMNLPYRYTRSVNAALNGDLARYDLNPELPKLKMRTLVVTGRFDINVAPSVAWKIHRAIPGSEFAVFEKSGHIPYFEERDAFVARLEQFLGR